MLIREAEINGRRTHVRLAGGRIAAVDAGLVPGAGERVIEAAGGALLPGLQDHHIHLNAAAAALQSVPCGPPAVASPAQLAEALQAAPGGGWIRGVGYHPQIGVELDRAWLDRHGPSRPIRVQHRSGRMWVLNSRAIEALGGGFPADGRVLDGDADVGRRLGGVAPDLSVVGARLASHGVTGLTEATVRNDLADFARYAAAGLPQALLVMGGPSLAASPREGRVRRGPVKLHYHDYDLPELDALAGEVGRAHDSGRPVAAHCVTRAELILILAAIEAAGPDPGDRIEHGAVIDADAAEWIAALGLTVVSQPHFLAERGAAYRLEVAADDRPWLYRLAGLKRAGVRLGAGSDAPFGGLNPWASMAAATARPDGFGEDEALDPEAALALYTTAADDPGGAARTVQAGAPADLCLIHQPWAAARRDLAGVTVRATIAAGRLVHCAGT